MYKTVSFNIFEEQLEKLVYGEESAERRREEYRESSRTEERDRLDEEAQGERFQKDRCRHDRDFDRHR